jgi:hypothetical protein
MYDLVQDDEEAFAWKDDDPSWRRTPGLMLVLTVAVAVRWFWKGLVATGKGLMPASK